MARQHVHEPSRIDDSESFRKWIPIVVPAAAGVFAVLIFLIGWLVLSRP